MFFFVTISWIQTKKWDGAAIAKTSITLVVRERVGSTSKTTPYDLLTGVLLCLTKELYGLVERGETMCRQKDLSFPGTLREHDTW